MSSLFVCPLCGEKLTRRENSYFCPNGHCHDVAREGYTYLLPVNRKHSKAPGDRSPWPPPWRPCTPY